MLFVNQIAEIIHTEVEYFNGSCYNDHPGFFIIWKFPLELQQHFQNFDSDKIEPDSIDPTV